MTLATAPKDLGQSSALKLFWISVARGVLQEEVGRGPGAEGRTVQRGNTFAEVVSAQRGYPTVSRLDPRGPNRTHAATSLTPLRFK